ncbi:hypothetical protein [Thermogutta sp.]|uniref:hypothetical protein n=1 Tax=Thermogutta sp. TaxID=1962930 RepID=UPI00321FDBA5
MRTTIASRHTQITYTLPDNEAIGTALLRPNAKAWADISQYGPIRAIAQQRAEDNTIVIRASGTEKGKNKAVTWVIASPEVITDPDKHPYVAFRCKTTRQGEQGVVIWAFPGAGTVLAGAQHLRPEPLERAEGLMYQTAYTIEQLGKATALTAFSLCLVGLPITIPLAVVAATLAARGYQLASPRLFDGVQKILGSEITVRFGDEFSGVGMVLPETDRKQYTIVTWPYTPGAWYDVPTGLCVYHPDSRHALRALSRVRPRFAVVVDERRVHIIKGRRVDHYPNMRTALGKPFRWATIEVPPNQTPEGTPADSKEGAGA